MATGKQPEKLEEKLEVVPGANMLWLLVKVLAGEMLIALLLPPVSVELTKELELLLLKV